MDIDRVKNTSELRHDPSFDLIDNVDASNPYLVARMEWNNMFFDLNRSKRNWQIASLFLLSAVIILSIGLTMLANKSQFLPYIVHVDRLGDAQFVNLVKERGQIELPEYRAFLNQYIRNAFNVIADPIAQKNALDLVYATTGDKANHTLNEYYKENDPFEYARERIKEIKVNSILPKSDKSWQVSWTETIRNLDGRIEGRKNYQGILTLTQHRVNDYQKLLLNPLGLFVEYFSWSQQQ